MGYCKSLLGALTLTVLASFSAQAAEFAIESQVFVGDDPQPFATNVTIFADHLIYDFAVKPNDRVTILDGKKKTFLLADTRQQTQSLLTVDELIRFVAAHNQAASQSKNALIRFAAQPKFETSFNEQTGQLSLSSDQWDYRVETAPIDNEELAAQYNEFSKWFTQLTALFRPIPPAVRMELNRELRQRQRLPVRVTVHLKEDGRTTVRQESRHRLITKLTERERALLKHWKDKKAAYLSVSFYEFRLAQLK